mmetsp:Transcript_19650/g.42728  ORF Transcript_19650/g.42728 Transcript_19650/m.42728 type:complete len:95 (-) Transcript_19650:805-1089(-)
MAFFSFVQVLVGSLKRMTLVPSTIQKRTSKDRCNGNGLRGTIDPVAFFEIPSCCIYCSQISVASAPLDLLIHHLGISSSLDQLRPKLPARWPSL